MVRRCSRRRIVTTVDYQHVRGRFSLLWRLADSPAREHYLRHQRHLATANSDVVSPIV